MTQYIQNCGLVSNKVLPLTSTVTSKNGMAKKDCLMSVTAV